MIVLIEVGDMSICSGPGLKQSPYDTFDTVQARFVVRPWGKPRKQHTFSVQMSLVIDILLEYCQYTEWRVTLISKNFRFEWFNLIHFHIIFTISHVVYMEPAGEGASEE